MDTTSRTDRPWRTAARTACLTLAITLPGTVALLLHTRTAAPPQPTVALTVKAPTADAPFPLPRPVRIPLHGTICDVRQYGARPDAPITAALTAAIAACADRGGGMVVVPPGTWTTGPITLRSNIILYLATGATLRFSAARTAYTPLVRSRYEGIDVYTYPAPLRAADCRNVAIVGGGTIDGQGPAWWGTSRTLQRRAAARLYAMGRAGTPVEERRFGLTHDGLRPPLLQFARCHTVLVEGITLRDGPMWTLHFLYTQHAAVQGVTIQTAAGPNTDGIVVDSSRDVIITESTIDAGDDAIALKAGRNHDGRRVNRPTERVIITRVTVHRGNSGIAIGSEMSGGVTDVLAHDLTFDGTKRGIRIKARPGRGGTIARLRFHTVTMRRTQKEAIMLNFQYAAKVDEPDDGPLPTLHDVTLRDITIAGAAHPLVIIGPLATTPEPPLTFEHITATALARGATLTDIAGVRLTASCFRARRGPAITLHNVRASTIALPCDPGVRPAVRITGTRTAALTVRVPPTLRAAVHATPAVRDDVRIATTAATRATLP